MHLYKNTFVQMPSWRTFTGHFNEYRHKTHESLNKT